MGELMLDHLCRICSEDRKAERLLKYRDSSTAAMKDRETKEIDRKTGRAMTE